MIKVNLLRGTQVTAIKKDGTFVTGISEGTRLAVVSDNKQLIVKFAIAVVGFVIFVIYLQVIESQKDSEAMVLDAVVAKKTEEKASLGPAIKAVDAFKKEKERVQVQIDTIKELSKERLRNVKALEALQNIIPEKAWLTLLKVEENKAEFEGSAVDDKIVADFMASLEENIYFANVRLIKTAELQTKEGTVKSFSIACSLEGI